MGVWERLGEELLQVIYPENLYCMACGDLLDGEEDLTVRWGLCGSCLDQMFCEENLTKAMGKDCEDRSYSQVLSCTVYGGLSKEIIGKFKNNGQPWLGKNLGRLMAQRFREEFGPEEERVRRAADLVTFVPVHRKKKRIRGYDQSAILAKQVGDSLGIPWAECLVRTRATAAMKNISEAQRRQNVEGAFDWKGLGESVGWGSGLSESARDGSNREGRELEGKRVILVDDVVTTGSTADACASVLRDRGAKDVILLTFAAAPHEKSH